MSCKQPENSEVHGNPGKIANVQFAREGSVPERRRRQAGHHQTAGAGAAGRGGESTGHGRFLEYLPPGLCAGTCVGLHHVRCANGRGRTTGRSPPGRIDSRPHRRGYDTNWCTGSTIRTACTCPVQRGTQIRVLRNREKLQDKYCPFRNEDEIRGGMRWRLSV